MASERGKRSVMTEQRVEAAYEFIKNYIQEHGYAPSYKEIGTVVNGHSQAYLCVTRLAARGKLKVTRGVSRGIVLA